MIEAAVQDAREGRTVLYVTQWGRQARDAFDAAMRISPDAEKRTVTPGHESISYPSGGGIRFLIAGERLRGHAADAVYAEDPGSLPLRQYQDLRVFLNARPNAKYVTN